MTADTAGKHNESGHASDISDDTSGAIADPDGMEHPPFMSPEATRKLTVAVVVMGIILVLGFAALIAGLIYRSADLAQGSRKHTVPNVLSTSPATGSAGTRSSQFYRNAVPGIPHTDIPVPPGARITHVAVEGPRATLTVSHAGGTSLLIVNTQSGEILRTFGFASPAKPAGD